MVVNNIISFINIWITSIWDLLLDSALLLLIGIFLAGIIHLFLNEKNISRFISKNSKSQVFKLSLLGIPLPLCSCSVLPIAYQLRKAGISKGGTVSFLISTPETGIDSILLTYSLMNPFMTIIRPIAAFITAFAAGLWESIIPDEKTEEANNLSVVSDCDCCSTNKSNDLSFIKKLLSGIKYAFSDLLGDIAFYLVIGYVLAGLVSALVGSDNAGLIENFSSGWGGYMGALIIGVPLYICATSSTPLAAALLAAGFSPGAVLVFLLVGPATNISSIVVILKILKGWGTVRYLTAIIVVSVLCGLAVDWIYNSYDFSLAYNIDDHHSHNGLVNIISAIILSGLIFYSFISKSFKSKKS